MASNEQKLVPLPCFSNGVLFTVNFLGKLLCEQGGKLIISTIKLSQWLFANAKASSYVMK